MLCNWSKMDDNVHQPGRHEHRIIVVKCAKHASCLGCLPNKSLNLVSEAGGNIDFTIPLWIIIRMKQTYVGQPLHKGLACQTTNISSLHIMIICSQGYIIRDSVQHTHLDVCMWLQHLAGVYRETDFNCVI